MAKHILIVEDDEFLRDVVTIKLTAGGFKVSFAPDGRQALDSIKKSKPDLMLLDLLLPGMSGFEVLEKIKMDVETGGIPVIIFSNLDSKENMEKGLKLGAADYMVKSQCTLEEIIEKIKKFI